MHKIQWDFEIQTDHLIPTIKPDQELINKGKKVPSGGVCRSSGPLSKNKDEETYNNSSERPPADDVWPAANHIHVCQCAVKGKVNENITHLHYLQV